MISILDEKGKIIDSFNSISSEAKESTNYNMQLSDFSSDASYKVTTKKGFNRFRWNLRHRGIYDDDEEKNIVGPFVKPGKYVVEVTLDNTNKISTEFSVEKDPNTEISQDVFVEVEQFQLKLINKIREATRILNEIKSLKLSKNLKKNKLQDLEAILEKLETKEGDYMQPMLIDQFKYLYRMVTEADQVLGKDAYDRFKELSLKFEKITQKQLTLN